MTTTRKPATSKEEFQRHHPGASDKFFEWDYVKRLVGDDSYEGHIAALNQHHEKFTSAIKEKLAETEGLWSRALSNLRALMSFTSTDIKEHKKNLDNTASKMYIAAGVVAEKAVSVRKGIFGVTNLYQGASAWLQDLGNHAEELVTSMPWQVRIRERSYYLVFLKFSPEAFLTAEENVVLNTYISMINDVKRNEPRKIKINLDGSNLNNEIEQYVSQVERICAINIKTSINSQIQRIETQRKSRGFFKKIADWFSPDETEKKAKEDIAQCQQALLVANLLQKNVDDIRAGTEDFRKQFQDAKDVRTARCVFEGLKNRLLDEPKKMEANDHIALRDAMMTLHGSDKKSDKKHEDAVDEFTKKFDTKLTQYIQLLSSDAAPIEELKVYFTFIAEAAVGKEAKLNELNRIREATVKSLSDRLDKFSNTREDILFLENLKLANASLLDKNLASKIASRENEKTTQLILQNEFPKLLKGQLVTTADATVEVQLVRLQEALVVAHSSSVESFRELAASSLEELEKELKANIRAVKNYGSEGTDMSAFKQKVAFFEVVKNAYDEKMKAAAPYAELEESEKKKITEIEGAPIRLPVGVEKAYQAIKATKKAVAQDIETPLTNARTPVTALQYIAKIEELGRDNLRILGVDSAIQVHKAKYNSWQIYEAEFYKLLSDEQTYDLSQKEIDDLLEATLYATCDEETAEEADESKRTDNKLILAMRNFSTPKLKRVEYAIECLKKLGALIHEDCLILKNDDISPEKLQVLRNRLQFFRKDVLIQADVMYLDNLTKQKRAVISSISSYLRNQKNSILLDAYLERLRKVWPNPLEEDPDLKEAMMVARETIIKGRFDAEEKKAYAELTEGLALLESGQLDGLARSRLTGKKQLTYDNLAKWAKQFVQKYIDRMFLLAKSHEYTRDEERVFYAKVLKESMQTKLKPIASKLSQTMRKMMLSADTTRSDALARLDAIFEQDRDQASDQVDSDEAIIIMMAQYLIVDGAQKIFEEDDDDILLQSSQEFIDDFHHMAQHDGRFTTQIISRLPKGMLEAMYETFQVDEAVLIEKHAQSKLKLLRGITGEVDDTAKTVQLPQYLLLNMTLDLINTAFNDLVAGYPVDIDHLNGLIEFAMPKLNEAIQLENAVTKGSAYLRRIGDENFSVSDAIRDELLLLVNNNLTEIGVRQVYEKLIKQYSTVKAESDGFITTNLRACEKDVLTQLKEKLLAGMSALEVEDVDSSAEEFELEAIKSRVAILKSRMKPSNQEELQLQINEKMKRGEILKAVIVKKQGRKALFEELTEMGDKPHKVKSLVEDATCLKQLLSDMNPRVLALLNQNDEAFFTQMKNNVTLEKLLGDEDFKGMLKKLTLKLNAQDANVFSILKKLTENVIKYLPPEEADMIRQLQYRFADRLTPLLSKTLSLAHLDCVEKAEQEAGIIKEFVPEPVKQEQTTSFASTCAGFFSWNPFAKGETPCEETREVTRDLTRDIIREASGDCMPMTTFETPRVRVGAALQKLTSNAFDQLMDALEQSGECVEHLYDLAKKSKPVKMQPVSHIVVGRMPSATYYEQTSPRYGNC